MEAKLLEPWKTWGNHSQDQKIAMVCLFLVRLCLLNTPAPRHPVVLQAEVAQEKLGWSVISFDNRMATYCQHYARKKKRRRERSGESSEEDTTNETKQGTPAKSPAKEDDGFRRFRPNAKVSIVDKNGKPLAHAVILDDEPEITDDIAGASTCPTVAFFIYVYIYVCICEFCLHMYTHNLSC